MPLRVAAYCRVSTDREDQANSLHSQRDYFTRYIQARQDWILTTVYADGPVKIGLNQKHPTARGALV